MRAFSEFKDNKDGNIGLMFGAALLCLTGAVGAAIDYGTMTTAKQKLQSAVDSAALSGAIVADTSRKKDRRKTVFETYAANDFSAMNLANISDPRVKFDDTISMVTVKAEAEVRTIFSGLMKASNTVTASSTVSYAVDDIKPISIAFVLDVSGSMDLVITGDSIKKIEALKDASEILFDAIEKGIGKKSTVEQVLRASLSGYNAALEPGFTTDMQQEKSRAMGTSTPSGQTTRGTIKTLSAMGGTNSTPALEDALVKLRAEKYINAETQLFLLFMTDGDNNDAAEDPKSRAVCDQARAEGVEIFSVAFDAPDKGKSLLLQCAGGSTVDGIVDESVCDGTAPSKDCEKLKSGYYYDAGNGKKLKKAFRVIGDNIGEQNIRIRS